MAAADQPFGAQSPQVSPQQSPFGSPHGQPLQDPHTGGSQQVPPGVPQGSGSPEMVELVRLVATATQAAADAATAAAQANAHGGGAERKKELYRLIPKPSVFAPENREQEVSLWRDWYWSLKQYLLVVDGKYETDLEEVERADHEEVDWDLLDDDEQHRGRFMYSLLSTLLQGRLLSLVRGVEKSNGMEALRQLLQNCQPRARSRTMSMLQGIMSYPAFNMKVSVRSER